MTRQVKYFPIRGGEDLMSAALTIDAGRLIFSRNYECDQDGRPRRIDGFERFDGGPAPSDASYCVLGFTGGSVEIEATAHVIGQVSLHEEHVLSVILESGSWAGGDAAGKIIMTGSTTGNYIDGETLSFTGPFAGFGVGFSGGFS